MFTTLSTKAATMLAALFALVPAGTSVASPVHPWPVMPAVGVPVSTDAAEPIAWRDVVATIDARRGAEDVASVDLAMVVETSADDTWVPLVADVVTVDRVLVNGATAALARRHGHWSLRVAKAGAQKVSLSFRAAVFARESARGLDVGLPRAASVALNVTLPSGAKQAMISPARDVNVGDRSGLLKLTATGAGGVTQIRWRRPARPRARVLAAHYSGEVQQDLTRWSVRVEAEADEVGALVPLGDVTMAIANAKLAGKAAALIEEGSTLCVRLDVPGRQEVQFEFVARVRHDAGPATTSLWLPRPPVATVTLKLPGDQEVSTTPTVPVVHTRAEDITTADIVLPPMSRVTMAWSPAVPELAAVDARLNADIHHTARADEGLIVMRAAAVVTVTRGSTHELRFDVGEDAVINSVNGPGVTDWRTSEDERQIVVHLDRELTGTHKYFVDYEVPAPPPAAGGKAGPIGLPLVSLADAHRGRGTLALLRGDELVLTPGEPTSMAAVGANALPDWHRSAHDAIIAHTFKFHTATAALAVVPAPRPKRASRFDADVETLLSVGDGILRASVTAHVSVKSGGLRELALVLPAGVNVVSVAAPSLRTHDVIADDKGGSQRAMLSFNQDIEGRVQIDLTYEQVLVPGADAVAAPLVRIEGARVEQGRIAVEALAAVEVTVKEAQHLLSLDVRELPRSLVLKTSHPVLIAQKYVHAEPAPALLLGLERHRDAAIRAAAIQQADYETLLTADGGAVTTARWTMTNRGAQFLPVALPKDAEVWRAGRGDTIIKPAWAKDGRLLLPLPPSDQPFGVHLTYYQSGESLGLHGAVRVALPLAGAVEEATVWDVFLPDDTVTWGEVESSLRIASTKSATVASGRFSDINNLDAGADVDMGEAVSGKRYQLRGMLTNRRGEPSWFEASYRRRSTAWLGAALAFFGGLFLLLGLLRILPHHLPVAIGGFVAAGVGMWALGAAWGWVIGGAVLGLVVWGAMWLRARTPSAAAAPPAVEEAPAT